MHVLNGRTDFDTVRLTTPGQSDMPNIAFQVTVTIFISTRKKLGTFTVVRQKLFTDRRKLFQAPLAQSSSLRINNYNDECCNDGLSPAVKCALLTTLLFSDV